MIQQHLETTSSRLVLGIFAGACLGTLLTALWMLSGWTSPAPFSSEGSAWSGSPLLFVSIGLLYWVPGLLLVGVPFWSVIYRHGYRRWFHLAALGAVLAAIYAYVALSAGWLVGLLLLGPPCWWFAYRDGQDGTGFTQLGLLLALIVSLVWLPLVVTLVVEALAGNADGLVLDHNVAVVSLAGAVVGPVAWSIAYRGKFSAGSTMRPA